MTLGVLSFRFEQDIPVPL